MSSTLDPCPIPKLTDQFEIITFKDGSSVIVKKVNGCVELKFKNTCSVGTIRFSDLVTVITQRAYDYHFYFGNFVSTDPSNTTAYNNALNQLMDLFSQKLTLYEVTSNGAIEPIPGNPFTTWDQVRQFQKFITSGIYFNGWTLHNMPNVRVRPILNNTAAQASSQTHLLEYDYTTIPGAQDTFQAANYNFTWAYEDGVWRIVTFYIDTRLIVNLTSLTTQAPAQYLPAKNVC